MRLMVGTGIRGGFNHSSKLNVINYNQAMRSNNLDKLTKWIKGMYEEQASQMKKRVSGASQDIL
jgi:hypothetical protein